MRQSASKCIKMRQNQPFQSKMRQSATTVRQCVIILNSLIINDAQNATKCDTYFLRFIFLFLGAKRRASASRHQPKAMIVILN